MNWNDDLIDRANKAKTLDELDNLELEAIDRRAFAALDYIRDLMRMREAR